MSSHYQSMDEEIRSEDTFEDDCRPSRRSSSRRRFGNRVRMEGHEAVRSTTAFVRQHARRASESAVLRARKCIIWLADKTATF